MNRLIELPELRALERPSSLVRIPDQSDVPLTPRIERLIDTAPMRRLSSIKQLGFVSLVYPGANHSRFEHSLGVYRMALLFLRQLAVDDRFQENVDPGLAEKFIVAALLHDIGHWPYCHVIEDLALATVPRHETLAAKIISESEIADCLRSDWQIEPDEIAELLSGHGDSSGNRLIASMLSGPIDVDKMDYLTRDSLHCGVPYGRNFDTPRLIASLCVNRAGDGIAITNKGRTAAELMVFARYVMFSEVYWHHAVRAASAMFQRAFYLLRDRVDMRFLTNSDDRSLATNMLRQARGSTSEPLLEGLFGPIRNLYKRWAQFSYFEHPDVFRRVARQPYSQLLDLTHRVSEILGRRMDREISSTEILIDAPPMELEVQFDVDVLNAKKGTYLPMAQLSPVVHSLAKVQFDDFVKQVRLFVHPSLAESIARIDAEQVIMESLAIE
jgi:HD superfamily phosphohydrolase